MQGNKHRTAPSSPQTLNRRAGLAFVPLVVETLGGWEELAEKQIKRLGAALARHTGQEEAEKTRHLFQRLAVLLAKGNAALFLNRVPCHPSATRNIPELIVIINIISSNCN